MTAVNIALEAFGIVIALILLGSSIGEIREKYARYFTAILCILILTFAFDIVSWSVNGDPQLRLLNIVANTANDCFGYVMITMFIRYLKNQTSQFPKALSAIALFFDILCVFAVIASFINVRSGYYFSVNSAGEYLRGDFFWLSRAFPLIAAITVMTVIFLMKDIKPLNRIVFLTYPVFPIVGLLFDCFVPGWAFTYLGVLISIVIAYTNIFQKKRITIAEQKTALMISQINPHFMYNTLTTIASLCDIEPKEAKRLTLDFSSYLRQNIGTLTENKLIPFEQEMNHIECYLKIEKARFKERINIVYALQAKGFFIPALSVQPLVENAVRHGVSKKIDGGTVRISTYETDKTYVIEIKDDGVGFDPEAPLNDGRKHYGIENVRERIKHMCNGTLTVKSMPGVGTRVVIEVPKKTATQR